MWFYLWLQGFLFVSNDNINFLETHKGVSSLFSQSQMKPHLILMYIPFKPYLGIFNSSILFMVPSKAFFFWYSQNRKFQLPCCSLFFSLFFLAGQSVLWQHFLGELLSCGNQAIFKFCRRVIFNFIYLLVILLLTMHSRMKCKYFSMGVYCFLCSTNAFPAGCSEWPHSFEKGLTFNCLGFQPSDGHSFTVFVFLSY